MGCCATQTTELTPYQDIEYESETKYSFLSVTNSLVWSPTRNSPHYVGIRAENIIPQQIHDRLLTEIIPLQRNVKDYRCGGKIHDLIDPSLNMNWFHNDLIFKAKIEAHIEANARDNSLQEMSSLDVDTPSITNNDDDYDNMVFIGRVNDTFINKPTGYMTPTIYDLNEYKFVSPINNLSDRKYGNTLYKTIAKVFKHMIPMFEYVLEDTFGNVSNDNNIDQLRLIVSMQDYILSNGQSYIGRLHKQGIERENIVAIGMYFFHVDTNIQGGNINIVKTFQFSSTNKIMTLRNKVSNIKTGTCIVISNIDHTYHKIGLTKNNIEPDGVNTILSRKILSFFLMYPTHKFAIKSTQDILVNWDDITLCVVNMWFRNEYHCKDVNNQTKWLPYELIQMIIDCVIGLGQNRYNLRDERIHDIIQFDVSNWYLESNNT